MMLKLLPVVLIFSLSSTALASLEKDSAQCEVNPESRVECGYAGITKEVCESRGCCFNPKWSGVKWCYKKTTSNDRCMVNPENRIECGWPGVTRQQCEAKDGCCFNNKTPNMKWCYKGVARNTETCDRDFWKIGCFNRNLKLLPDLLITDLDPTHHKFGKDVDWGKFGESLHSLACRCHEKAQGNYTYFGIGMYGECLGGNSNVALKKMMSNPTTSPYSCVNGNFDKCDVDDTKECAGAEDHDFFYELFQGDCSASIANGNAINLLSKETLIKKNTLLTTIAKVGTIYEVSLEVKPTKFAPGWSNVLHMTVGGTRGIYGSRVPGIWFHPSSASATTNHLHICSAIIGNLNHCYNSKPFPLNVWIKIRINQVRSDDGYRYSIYLDNQLVYNIRNTRSASFANVKVYAADPWYAAQAGYIRNLRIAEDCYSNPSKYEPTLSLPAEALLKRNTLVGGLSQLCKQYSFTFDVKPTAFAAGWHSVLHATLGGNAGVYGDRAPGVWFHPSSSAAATNQLHICSPINGVTNYCYNSKHFPTNQWISVQIGQRAVGSEYYYSISLDGNEVYKVKNTAALVYYELLVYASDPWYPAQIGYIRNLQVNGGQC